MEGKIKINVITEVTAATLDGSKLLPDERVRIVKNVLGNPRLSATLVLTDNNSTELLSTDQLFGSIAAHSDQPVKRSQFIESFMSCARVATAITVYKTPDRLL